MMRVFKRRRGRKSKIDKMLEAAAIDAMVRGSAAHPDSLLSASGASSIYAGMFVCVISCYKYVHVGIQDVLHDRYYYQLLPIYPFISDWSKMLGQSPSTTPQPQPTTARDGSGKLGKEDKIEDKDALKFSAENLSSDWLVI